MADALDPVAKDAAANIGAQIDKDAISPPPVVPKAVQVGVQENLDTRRVEIQFGNDLMVLTVEQARSFALAIRQCANKVERAGK